MLISKKTQGFFLEISDHGILMARTSAQKGPMVVEALKSCAPNDLDALQTALRELQPKRTGPGHYVHAACGVYPARRLIRRATLDPKRYKEPTYLNEVVNSQFRVEADKYALVVLDASTGLDLDLAKATQKEALFAGLANEEVSELQKRLLGSGVYPETLELGTLATLGGLVNYLSSAETKTPTLVLEIDVESTQSFILSETGVDASRPIPQGLSAMIPIVQKELGLKDEESARKLFYSNTFDFAGMGPVLIKKLLKELQSSIGFYEVQTGQSIGQVACTLLPPKLGWLESVIASQLGVSLLKIDFPAWLKKNEITFDNKQTASSLDIRSLGLLSLMISHTHAHAAETKS